MAEITFGEAYGEVDRNASRNVSVVHLLGGIVSLGLIVGVAVWGGTIVMRDVSGIPVVRALSDGPMRIAPDNPGGNVAVHAGLTVNDVAAEGEAGAPEDRLVLAPQSVDVAEEDLEVTPTAEAGEVPPAPQEAGVVTAAANADQPLTADEVLELADRVAAQAQAEGHTLLTETAEPGTEPSTADAVAAAVAAAVVEVPAPAIEVISASIPGVARSKRPVPRPATATAVPDATLANASVVPATTPSIPVTGDLPVGTRLVQLGAYETADLARTDWTRISGRFSDFMVGKDPVIQEATSGGQSFFRLRAQGFEDVSDARRFCAVLMAENAACIPVVVR